MWWNGQNLNKPVTGKDGKEWHFRVWHDHIDGVYTQRVFFWDGTKRLTGVVELPADKARHVSRLKGLFRKIASDVEYREKYYCDLAFPLERHYQGRCVSPQPALPPVRPRRAWGGENARIA